MAGNLTVTIRQLPGPFFFLNCSAFLYRHFGHLISNTCKSFQSSASKFLSCDIGKERGTLCLQGYRLSLRRVRNSLDTNQGWQIINPDILPYFKRFGKAVAKKDYYLQLAMTRTSASMEPDSCRSDFRQPTPGTLTEKFDVHVTVHSRHSEGKEPTRCDKVCSFIASTCFGHQYAHHQEYN
jgi:hypothetical protein